MEVSTIHEPAWVNDMNLLKEKIQLVLGDVVKYTDMKEIVNDDSLNEYWTQAFTHKSADVNYNNAMFTVYGDAIMRYVFTQYLRDRFGDKLTPQKLTLLTNKYLDSKYLVIMADRLGLLEYVRRDIFTRSTEDIIIKSFICCFHDIVSEEMNELFAFKYCYDFIDNWFKDVPINIDDIKADAKTQLKELFEKNGWRQPVYMLRKLDDGCDVAIKSRGKIIGIGRAGLKKDAEMKAAENALIFLKA
jgi:dsRNA-specific ribonuclease